MDKEAQERVAGCISANFNSTVSDMDIAAKVLSLLEELGYRKLEGKPPLLDIICPFCGQDSFDKAGLKYHLSNYCKTYQDTENV